MFGCQKFWSTSGEKDKFPLILLEAVKFELQVPRSLVFIFFQKSFIGT